LNQKEVSRATFFVGKKSGFETKTSFISLCFKKFISQTYQKKEIGKIKKKIIKIFLNIFIKIIFFKYLNFQYQ